MHIGQTEFTRIYYLVFFEHGWHGFVRRQATGIMNKTLLVPRLVFADVYEAEVGVHQANQESAVK